MRELVKRPLAYVVIAWVVLAIWAWWPSQEEGIEPCTILIVRVYDPTYDDHTAYAAFPATQEDENPADQLVPVRLLFRPGWMESSLYYTNVEDLIDIQEIDNPTICGLDVGQPK